MTDLIRLNPHSVDPIPAYFRPSDGLVIRQGLRNEIVRFLSDNRDLFRCLEVMDENTVAHDVASYPNDISIWSSTHIDLYNQLIARAASRLKASDLSLKDGHPYNCVFFGSQPYFVDLGSIFVGDDWKQFERENSLYQGIARTFRFGSQLTMRKHLVTRSAPSKSTILWSATKGVTGKDPVVPHRERLLRLMLGKRHKPLTNWTHYGKLEKSKEGMKSLFLRECLSNARPARMIDIGCNVGKHSVIAAEDFGAKVLAIDFDELAISELTRYAHSRGLDITTGVANLPLYLEVLNGNPPVLNPHEIDFVLCYAVLHHLVHWQGYHFISFFNELARLNPSTLLVEFVTYDDVHVSTWKPKKDWYSLDVFCEMAKQYNFRSHIERPHNKGRYLVLLTRP